MITQISVNTKSNVKPGQLCVIELPLYDYPLLCSDIREYSNEILLFTIHAAKMFGILPDVTAQETNKLILVHFLAIEKRLHFRHLSRICTCKYINLYIVP